MRYLDWDFDTGVVTEYRRVGQCLRCGKCCNDRVRFSVQAPSYGGDPHNGGSWHDGEGVWSEARLSNGKSYWFKITGFNETGQACPKFHDGRCTAYDGRPVLCAVWPLTPRHTMPGCGFSFEIVETSEICPSS